MKSVMEDYICMVRELNKHKRLIRPVDPFTLPQVQRMQSAIRDLGLAAGLREYAEKKT